MQAERKDLIFNWKPKDRQPFRTLLSLILAAGSLFLFFTYIPLPFSQETVEQEKNYNRVIENSQNMRSVSYLSESDLYKDRINLHFTLYDPVNTQETVIEVAENIARFQINDLTAELASKRPKRPIQFAEIPFSVPVRTTVTPIEPDLPSPPLRLPSYLHKPQQYEVTVAATPSLEFSVPPPMGSIGDGLASITYEVAISSLGTVDYALPLRPNFRNTALKNWLLGLSFTTATPGSYAVTFTERSTQQ